MIIFTAEAAELAETDSCFRFCGFGEFGGLS
jgi:hypothetical protein